MYKVYWNNGKAQQLFLTLNEAKQKRKELLDDGEDNITISQQKEGYYTKDDIQEKRIIGKY